MNSATYLLNLIRYRANPLHVHYLSNRRVLDVGCGEGEFIARDRANRVGVDIDPDLVRTCKDNGLDARCMSATDLQFPDDSFDVVHAAELIEHFTPSTAARFLSEAARVLKPRGIVYLTTPGECYVWNTFSHVRPYPPSAFSKLLSRSTEGFIRDRHMPLELECFYSFGSPTRMRMLTGLKRSLDIALPPKWPTGYVIILRKLPHDAQEQKG